MSWAFTWQNRLLIPLPAEVQWKFGWDEKDNLLKAIRLLGFLPEEKIDVDQYQQILERIFEKNVNILSSLSAVDRSNLNRMIRIYDYLRYGQKKTP